MAQYLSNPESREIVIETLKMWLTDPASCNNPTVQVCGVLSVIVCFFSQRRPRKPVDQKNKKTPAVPGETQQCMNARGMYLFLRSCLVLCALRCCKAGRCWFSPPVHPAGEEGVF